MSPGGRRRLRLGLARLSQETNARSPLPTALDDVRRAHWIVGEALGAAIAPGGTEAPGFLRRAELAGAAEAARADGDVDVVPLSSAWAVPGGPMEADAWAALREDLLARVDAAGPLDGLLVVLHGALRVRGEPAPEAALLQALRARLGRAPLAAVLDLHGHLDADKLEAVDLLLAYKTNPHRDHAEVGARALRLLAAAARGEIHPTATWRALPVVLGGGTTVDLLPGMARAFWALRRANRTPGVLDASLFLCHPWLDDPSAGWAVHVVTDRDPALADAVADGLADALWARRTVPIPTPLSAAEAAARVRRSRLRRRLGPAVLVDTSDTVGAGAPGDHTGLLRALGEHGPDLRSYFTLRDPAAVALAHAVDHGEDLDWAVGGAWSDGHRVAVRGRVVHRAEAPVLGRTATLELGHAAVVLTEGPPLALRPQTFAAAGLPPRAADAIAVKSLLLWLPHFLTTASQRMLVQTGGPTDFDAILDLDHPHPVHPRDALDDWRPHDRQVRGLTRSGS